MAGNAQLAKLTLTAPFDGVVTSILFKPGDIGRLPTTQELVGYTGLGHPFSLWLPQGHLSNPSYSTFSPAHPGQKAHSRIDQCPFIKH